MSAVICVLCLVGACVALAFGLTRLPAAVFRIRHYTATRPIRDAAFVAQARAELHRNEIEASTRGDLLAAASYAELADRDYAVSMLDQQDMGEGWS